MSYFSPAPLDDIPNSLAPSNSLQERRPKRQMNRTIKKRRDLKNEKVMNFIENLENDSDSDDDMNQPPDLPKPELQTKKTYPQQNIPMPYTGKHTTELGIQADYSYDPSVIPSQASILNNPHSQNSIQQQIQQLQQQQREYMRQQKRANIQNDNEVTVEQFSTMPTNTNTPSFVPYYTQTGSGQQEIHGSKDVLLEKLNYMIHLLEDQKEEKTGHVTEELILYTFLGAFVIFVVDSFARVGKYVR